MRKVIFLLVVWVAIFAFLNPLGFNVNASSKVVEEDIGALSSSETLIDVIRAGENWLTFIETLSEDNEKEFCIKNNNTYLLTLESSYQAHQTKDNILFLATQDAFYKINLYSFQYEKLSLPLEIVKEISFHEDKIWIIGSKESDACIVKLNMAGEVLSIYQYGGLGFECFDQLLWVDNMPYLTGHKDAYSYQSPFSNVGNEGDTKAFLTRMLSNFEIVDTIYFNHQTQIEMVSSTFCREDQIYLYLKDEDTFHFYQINDSLEIEFYQDLDVIDANGIISDSGYFIEVLKTGEGIYWQVSNEEWNEDNKLIDSGEIITVTMEQGELITYILLDTTIKRISCNEYHIVFLKPYYVNRMNKDVDSLSNVNIQSYFEELNFHIKKIEPYFDKLISGTYDVTYEALREDGSAIEVTSQIIVEDYANVMNKGVYSVGHTLSFFGNASLNGEGILNGYQLNTPGHYQLLLTDVQGIERFIEFDVVADFYQSEVSPLIPSDLYLTQGESISIPIDYPEPNQIEGVFVNGELITDYTINDRGIELIFLAPNTPSTDSIRIDKLLLSSGNEVPINETLVITTYKQIPEIVIEEKEAENLTLLLRLTDPNQALIDIETLVYQNEELVGEYSSFLQDFEIDLNIDQSATYRIITEARYELGDGIEHTKVLIDYEGTISKRDYTFLTIDAKRLGSVIDQVEIVVNTNNHNLHHNYLRVNDNDIAKSYQIERNMKVINSALILTGVVILIFGYFIYKKRKEKSVL